MPPQTQSALPFQSRRQSACGPFPPLTLLLLGALVIALSDANAHADQLLNGGFEQPATSTFTDVIAPNSSTIPGWTVTAGSVDVVNAAGNGFDVGAAYAGAQYLDLNGSAAGTLAQTFSTTPGANYQLSFAYANNYDPPTSLTAQVTLADGSGNLINTNVSHSTSASGNLHWTIFNQIFIARQSSATLTFASQNPGDGGIFLDAISVTPIILPTLFITNTHNQTATISWTTNAPAFHLIATSNLVPPIQWSAVTNQPVINGTSFQVNVSTTIGNQFFALRSP